MGVEELLGQADPSRDPIDIALRGEVKQQCWRARLAGSKLYARLSSNSLAYDANAARGREAVVVVYNIETWTDVHTVLSAAGVVARVLFPKPPGAHPPTTQAEAAQSQRAKLAELRARAIWKIWPLPPKDALRSLQNPSARNAMEHAENEAPEWFTENPHPPLFAYGMGRQLEKGKPTGMRGAFRFLFQEIGGAWRAKIGAATCNLDHVLEALKKIEDVLPTKALLDVRLPFFPYSDKSGERQWLMWCPLPPVESQPSEADG
jgi:hypothetical protein